MTISDRYSVLTHVGPGTPMGHYMRFFWHPIAAVAELKDHPKQVRILGEDLVLFRTTNGKLGLLAERCAHRSASLGCGMIEDDGIRCAYHAWKYDLTGQCVDIPSERDDRKVSSRIKISGYMVHEAGGLIWAYLGAQPAPLLPRYEFIVGEQYDHDVGLSDLPCNWLQIAENNMDPYHVEYLHFMYTNYVHERIGKPRFRYAVTQRSTSRSSSTGSSSAGCGRGIRKTARNGRLAIRRSGLALQLSPIRTAGCRRKSAPQSTTPTRASIGTTRNYALLDNQQIRSARRSTTHFVRRMAATMSKRSTARTWW